jgi:hypothetical protein
MLRIAAKNKDSENAVKTILRKERLRKACFSRGESGIFKERRDGENIAMVITQTKGVWT